MTELLYIKEYYFYLLIFLFVTIILSVFTYTKGSKNIVRIINFITISFGLYTVFYIGNRDYEIGVDTGNYKYAFDLIKFQESLEIKKDPLYDAISYFFAKHIDFQSLLIFCSFLYIFCALFGLKKIFKQNYYLPFTVFLITPYFFQFGINVMRNGVAASIFLVALGYYYTNDKKWKIIATLLFSMFFHISMIVPLLFFLITKYIKKTEYLFVAWLFSIVLAVLKMNIAIVVADFISTFTIRVGNYAQNVGEKSSWSNFLIFGAFPVLFAVYNIFVLKYANIFYKRLINAYILTHIPYIILIDTEYALRFGYLSEFMMPVLLLFPLMIEPKIKFSLSRIKICVIILFVFLLKAYKI